MSEGRHDLAHEFPEYKERIHALKISEDAHVSDLFSAWHHVAKELHAIEAGTETPGDVYVEDLKKRRLKLKDEIYEILKGS